MPSEERTALARRLLGAGVSLRGVLAECRIRQADIMRAAGLVHQKHVMQAAGPVRRQRRYQGRCSHVLSHPDAPGSKHGARREGAAFRLRIYEAASRLLGIRVADIPEAADLLPPPSSESPTTPPAGDP